MPLLRIRKTAYLEHIMRHQEYEKLQLVLEGKIEGKRIIGKKKKLWLRNIREWKHTDGNTLIQRARDRESYAIMFADLNRDSTW